MNGQSSPASGFHEQVKTLIRDNDLIEAFAQIQDFLATNPGDAKGQFLLGRTRDLLGDAYGAEEAYQAALASDPDLSEAYERLGRAYLERNALTEARNVFERWSVQLPADPGARHWLAVTGAVDMPDRADAAYVQTLYQGFAEDFDVVMQRIDYLGPMYVGAALERELGDADQRLTILDAGCGTGLCAEELSRYAARLIGLDLSQAMLDRAKERAVYDELLRADFAAPGGLGTGPFDVVCCTEALIYFGALETAFGQLSALLRPGGLLIATTEATSNDDGTRRYVLGQSGRYRHHDDYLEASLIAAGFKDVQLSQAFLRTEGGEPVVGWLATAKRVD